VTNDELIREWRDGEQRQRELWQEILSRGLYFQSLGIDLERRDSSWRNPPRITDDSEREFYRNVHGHKRPKREQKQRVSQRELLDFE